MKPRTPFAIAAALAAASTFAGPAAAIDDSKPPVSCYGTFFTDKAGDATSQGPGAGQANGNKPTPNLDLVAGFYKYDAAKGDEATTVNFIIKDLSTDIPEGATSLAWMLRYGGSDGAEHWVRAATDFSGVVTYDYGGLTDASATTFSTRVGSTQGAFFEGENGVIQLVIPTANGDGKVGYSLKGATAYGYEANSPVPQAAPTPIKGGFLYEDDSAPGKGAYTVGSACPSAPPASPPPVVGPSGAKPIQPVDKPLPLTLQTKSVKAKKAKKALALKVKSSEALTQVAAQLKKGTKVLGKSTVVSLNGAGTIKLKVKKLKKGSYVVDFAGTDASGARRFTSAKLKIN